MASDSSREVTQLVMIADLHAGGMSSDTRKKLHAAATHQLRRLGNWEEETVDEDYTPAPKKRSWGSWVWVALFKQIVAIVRAFRGKR